MAGLNRLVPNTIQVKSKGQQKKLRCKDIEAVLINCNGLTTKAADALGISYFALEQAIKDNPKLAKILSQGRRDQSRLC